MKPARLTTLPSVLLSDLEKVIPPACLDSAHIESLSYQPYIVGFSEEGSRGKYYLHDEVPLERDFCVAVADAFALGGGVEALIVLDLGPASVHEEVLAEGKRRKAARTRLLEERSRLLEALASVEEELEGHGPLVLVDDMLPSGEAPPG